METGCEGGGARARERERGRDGSGCAERVRLPESARTTQARRPSRRLPALHRPTLTPCVQSGNLAERQACWPERFRQTMAGSGFGSGGISREPAGEGIPHPKTNYSPVAPLQQVDARHAGRDGVQVQVHGSVHGVRVWAVLAGFEQSRGTQRQATPARAAREVSTEAVRSGAGSTPLFLGGVRASEIGACPQTSGVYVRVCALGAERGRGAGARGRTKTREWLRNVRATSRLHSRFLSGPPPRARTPRQTPPLLHVSLQSTPARTPC